MLHMCLSSSCVRCVTYIIKVENPVRLWACRSSTILSLKLMLSRTISVGLTMCTTVYFTLRKRRKYFCRLDSSSALAAAKRSAKTGSSGPQLPMDGHGRGRASQPGGAAKGWGLATKPEKKDNLLASPESCTCVFSLRVSFLV